MRHLCILLFCLFPMFAIAQVPKSFDSLTVFLKTKPKDTTYVKALNEYSFLLIQQGEFEEANRLIVQMERLSKKHKYTSGYYMTANMKGVVAYSKQKPEDAMKYFLESTVIIEKYALPKKSYQNALNNIAIIYDQMGDAKNATIYSMKLINLQEKSNLQPFKSFPYNQIADNLKSYKRYNEATIYVKKALDIEVKLKNNSGIAIYENSLGNIYDDMKQIDVALNHYKKGLNYAELANYPQLETDLLINIGRMYNQLGNYSKSEYYYKRSEKICKEHKTDNSLKITYQNLGNLYMDQKRYSLAETNYLKALKIAETITNLEYLQSANEALAEFNYVIGNFKKAYDFKKSAEILKDSTFKLETIKSTENLLRKYEAEKKEQKIKTLSAQNIIKNLEIKNGERQRYYFIFGIMLLGTIGCLLFYQSRNRKKTNNKLQLLNIELDEANKAKTRFFSILNHDLRSPVANLVFFLQLQNESPELLDEATTKRMKDKTMIGAENLLNAMEDILQWSKSQMENFKPQPTEIFISSLFQDIENHFSSEEKIKFTFENPTNIQVHCDENYLKTIIRNLTGNAVKALGEVENPTVLWKVWQDQNETRLSITDNGSGATDEQFKALYDDKEVVGIKSGLGLHLIRDLAKAINCQITVVTEIKKGTTITLTLKNDMR